MTGLWVYVPIPIDMIGWYCVECGSRGLLQQLHSPSGVPCAGYRIVCDGDHRHHSEVETTIDGVLAAWRGAWSYKKVLVERV